MPASIFSETELARLASFPEEIPGDDLIRAIHADGCRPRPRRHPAGGSKPLEARASALCTSLPRLRSAQFERSSAIGRLLCRGPARGQPGRDSILRSTRADAPTALHRGSGTPRLLDAPVTGLGRTRSLAGSNGPLSTMLRRFSFASLVSGGAPRGSSFQPPDRIVRLVSSARGRTQERTYTLVDPQVARAGCFWREPWDPSRARWPNWRFSASWEPMSGYCQVK